MSENAITEKTRSGVPVWVIVLAVTAFALLLGAGSVAARGTVTVVVDGEQRRVDPGTTVADLAEQGLLAGRSGVVRAVDGSVLATAGGADPLVRRNGRVAPPERRVYEGDVLTSVDGADTTETVRTLEEPVPIEVRTEGEGPILRLKSPGSVGLVRVTRGVRSGIEVSSTTLVAGEDMVLVRTRATSKDRLVALTFDDGPWPGQTEKILRILEREGVHATFFMLGARAKKSPALARRVAAEGHQIGSHSYSHKPLSAVTPALARREIRGGQTAIAVATGAPRPQWLRPPYGAMDSAAWREARIVGVKVALWDVDSRDWERKGTKRIENSVVDATKPGSVVLFHDGGGDRSQTIRALPGIIHRLRAKGYTFVTVEELDQAR